MGGKARDTLSSAEWTYTGAILVPLQDAMEAVLGKLRRVRLIKLPAVDANIRQRPVGRAVGVGAQT